METSITIDVSVDRLDLVRFNLSTLFKIRANWIMFFMLWGLVAIIVFLELNKPIVEVNYLNLIPMTFVGAIAAFAFMFLFMMVFSILASGGKSGWVGPRTYFVEDEGLRETTVSGSQIRNWGSIQDIIGAGRMMMIRLDPVQFFLIPKRGCKDPLKYQEFCELVQQRWKDAV